MLLIYVPTKNKNEAKEIGKKLVEERMVACANIIPNITSYFIYEGKVTETDEALLLLKTNRKYEDIKRRIEELHSYEIPLISALELDELNEKYAAWANEVQA
ncbi:MAG: divalent-cation tolerance protein CutA [archaeon]